MKTLTASFNKPARPRFHIDILLFGLVMLLAGYGLFILISASNQNMLMIRNQAIRMGLTLVLMLAVAQLPVKKLYTWTPWLYVLGLGLLILVLIIGKTSQGAQRWLNLGLFHVQPSEFVKLTTPMMLAWILDKHPWPPRFGQFLLLAVLIAIPVILTAKQPDLGTAIIMACSAGVVILMTGIRLRWLLLLFIVIVAASPVIWHHLHAYQQQRILTFLNPARDPLGKGYHIIQSKIAIGSGGIWGKGWLHGTQSHLEFLPAHATDFIFAVLGEELGLVGAAALILLYVLITLRCLYMSAQAQPTFHRLLAVSLSTTLITSAFVNIGMVTGVLPVVGIPLPLVSYGGTAMISLGLSFGMIMAIYNDQTAGSRYHARIR